MAKPEPELDELDPRNYIPRTCPKTEDLEVWHTNSDFPVQFPNDIRNFRFFEGDLIADNPVDNSPIRLAIRKRLIMSRETSLSNAQQEFIQRGISEKTRLDGRELDQYRDLSIFFEDYGHVEVFLGNTRVMVTISANVTKPRDESPFDGLFAINLELDEMASPAFQSTRAGMYESKVVEILEQVYRRSGALDTESLCIVAGKSCWKVNAHILVKCYDGNMLDASAIGLLTALQHFRLLDTEVRKGQPVVYSAKEREPLPLNLTYKPLVVSYSCFDDNKILILDPTRQEEQAAMGEFAVGLDTAGIPSLIKTLAGPELDPPAALDQASLALDQVITITEEIEAALKKDLEKRGPWKVANEARSNNERPVDVPAPA